MRKARVLLAGVLMVGGIAAVPRPAMAYGPSCATFTFTAAAADCFYQAAGAGQYRAVTASGWKISISRDGGPFTLVRSATQGSCAAPHIQSVSIGSIPSVAGDLVKLEINAACLQENTPAGKIPASPLRYQLGYIAGGPGDDLEPPAVPEVPTLDPSNLDNAANSCVATDLTGVISTGTLRCTYTAMTPTGEVVHSTPNKIVISAGGTLYSQPSLTPPGRATFGQPVGATITVVVGPDTAFGPVAGAVGLVVAGDSI